MRRRLARVAPRPGETLRAALERTLQRGDPGRARCGPACGSRPRGALAAQVGVSRGVVSDAYGAAGGAGLPRGEAARGAGGGRDRARRRRARRTPGARVAAQPRFDMTPTTPDVTLFPRRAVARGAVARGARRAGPALDYGDSRGEPALREALADHLGRTRGVIADPSQILVVQGTAQGLDVLLRTPAGRAARGASRSRIPRSPASTSASGRSGSSSSPRGSTRRASGGRDSTATPCS